MRKYYDEDEDEFEQESQRDEQPSFLPAVRLQWWDWALALVVGGLTFVGLVAFAFPGLCPDVWNDAAVAAGLRPPQTIFPGFWRVIAQLFYLGGVEAGNAGLVWAGRVCAALTGVAGYLFLLITLRCSCRLFPLAWKSNFFGEGMGMVKLGIAFTLAGIMGSAAEMIVRSYLNVCGGSDVVGLYNAAYTCSHGFNVSREKCQKL